MNRRNVVLAAMAASDGAQFTPVQIQKFFFLIDQKIPTVIGGKKFNFEAFDYGPYDHEVYRELEGLQKEGLASIRYSDDRKSRKYQLTPSGQTTGMAILSEFPPQIAEYLKSLSHWIRSLSFSELVSAIYAEFPEMKANSVFREY